MFCPECKKEDRKSRVTPGFSSSTMMYCPPFYDEDGRYHVHDVNQSSTEYSCSNGHRWTEVSRPSCWCGWPQPKPKEA